MREHADRRETQPVTPFPIYFPPILSTTSHRISQESRHPAATLTAESN
jgi:hypothetical protein